MRLRKTVLLFCPRAEEGSSWAWMFDLWGYAVTPFTDGDAAMLALYEREFELLVFMPGSVFDRDLLRTARRAVRDMEELQYGRGFSTLLYDPHDWLPVDFVTTALRVQGDAADLRAGLRLAMLRKRGPRKLPVPRIPLGGTAAQVMGGSL